MKRIVVSFLIGFVLVAGYMAAATDKAKAGPNDAWWRPTYTAYVLIVSWGWAGNVHCEGLGPATHWPPNYYPRYQRWFCQDSYRDGWVQTTGDVLTKSSYMY